MLVDCQIICTNQSFWKSMNLCDFWKMSDGSYHRSSWWYKFELFFRPDSLPIVVKSTPSSIIITRQSSQEKQSCLFSFLAAGSQKDKNRKKCNLIAKLLQNRSPKYWFQCCWTLGLKEIGSFILKNKTYNLLNSIMLLIFSPL